MAPRRPLDDSDDSEATSLELRSAPRSRSGPMRPAPSPADRPSRTPLAARALPAPADAAPPSATAAIPAVRTVNDDDDEDATEYLVVRPAPDVAGLSAGSKGAAPADPPLRARGRAVPIGGESGAATGVAHPAADSSPTPRAPGRDRTEPLNLDRGGQPRPLPDRFEDDDRTAGTRSLPRITRLQLPDWGIDRGTDSATESATDSATEPGAETGKRAAHGPQSPLSPRREPPPPWPARSASHAALSEEETLAETVRGDAAVTERIATLRRAPPTTRISREGTRDEDDASSTGELPGADGVLVIDAPADAVVTVNGTERGRGRVRVSGLDRHARHTVRIQCNGFHSWSGSVTLDGRAAAKLRPTLKPRAR